MKSHRDGPSDRALAAEAGDGQGRQGQERVPDRLPGEGTVLREPYVGTRRNRRRTAAHGATQNPFSGRRRHARWGNGNRGQGTWNRTAMVWRVAKVVAG